MVSLAGGLSCAQQKAGSFHVPTWLTGQDKDSLGGVPYIIYGPHHVSSHIETWHLLSVFESSDRCSRMTSHSK